MALGLLEHYLGLEGTLRILGVVCGYERYKLPRPHRALGAHGLACFLLKKWGFRVSVGAKMLKKAYNAFLGYFRPFSAFWCFASV